MSLSPAPFLRLGFAILGLPAAFAVWLGDTPQGSTWRLLLGGFAFFLVNGVGEIVFRRVATPAEIRADLEDRVRDGD